MSSAFINLKKAWLKEYKIHQNSKPHNELKTLQSKL